MTHILAQGTTHQNAQLKNINIFFLFNPRRDNPSALVPW